MNDRVQFSFASLAIVLLSWTQLVAQDSEPDFLPPGSERLAVDSAEVYRWKDRLFIRIDTEQVEPVRIPRFAAAIRSQRVASPAWQAEVSIRPEQDYWLVAVKPPATSEKVRSKCWVELEFDSSPLLMQEIVPIKPSGDGSFFLPAHLAVTAGEKVRYEPQPHKNTVGYWTGKRDTATWEIQLVQPGTFNVAILQGCGKGNGGSKAKLEFSKLDQTMVGIDFVVEETGHFQNFQWRHLGTVELKDVGIVQLNLRPEMIKNAALMDVRAIHLIRLP